MFTESEKRYVKVGPVDVAFAGTRTSVMVGPVEHRGADYALAAFRQLAERGPSARVGLQPSSTTNKWLFDPGRCGVVSTIEECGFGELLSVFEHFTAEASSHTEPVVVTFCGSYVMLSFDHGIGDATACLELAAVASGGDVADYLVPSIDQPLRTALGRAVRANPGIVMAARSRGRAGGLETRPYPPADAKSIIMTHVRTGPDFLATIKTLRKQHFPETSVTAAVTYALRSAFEAHGRTTTDDLSTLVDLRRFLGASETTLANLSGVADITVPVTADISEFGACFADAVRGAAPLVRLAGSVTKQRLRGWPAPNSRVSDWPVNTRLTVSDPTRHPSMKKIKWLVGGLPPAFVLINDPTLPHQVTITAMCDSEQCFQFTASYFSGSYERAEIDTIMRDVAKDPTPYLSSSSFSGAL